ncbi:uncharacterized protein LOC122264562 [Penaeus japonicus]|uniref:uncharacterized protein LOC122264562 n=1 Tax=Penaeus japonicus TaxID=27405 RepID=UPI001C715E8D|nr:uncharacterized protein LOC122264562 [Penaeus japonicus]
MVDTGCNYTSVSYDQVEKWGLQDKTFFIEENEVVHVHFQIGDVEAGGDVMVYHTCAVNLLGLNMMRTFCCIIDLKADTLTFRERKKVPVMRMLLIDCEVAGKPAECQLDTGASSFLTGTLENARDFELPLVDISSEGRYMITVDNPKAPTNYIAYDVCVKICSGERKKVPVMRMLLIDCEVAGKPAECQLDTGASSFLTSTLENARDFELPLVDISSEGRYMITVDNPKTPTNYIAYDVCVKTHFRERKKVPVMRMLLIDCEVAGKPAECQLDTGASSFLTSTLENARDFECRLDLTSVRKGDI